MSKDLFVKVDFNYDRDGLDVSPYCQNSSLAKITNCWLKLMRVVIISFTNCCCFKDIGS